jgi:ubiquinone/menaquinone biosynthesis C-methylase UbiE
MDRSEKFWDRTAKNFDQQDDQYDPSYVETIKSYLRPDDTVLDFACGTGSFSCLIANDVKEIQAIDISSKMLAIAERKAAKQEIENLNFMHATPFDERFKTGTFNVILAFNILHLLKETPQILQRINNLLAPGGYFISDTPCLGEVNSLFRITITLISKLPMLPYVKNFGIAELKGSITHANFKIAEAQKLSQSPPTLLIAAKKE